MFGFRYMKYNAYFLLSIAQNCIAQSVGLKKV